MIQKIVAGVLLFLFITVSSVSVLAATNLGKDNVFSQLATLIPVEQVPGLKALAKSDAQLLRDALTTESSFDLTKKLNGREFALNGNFSLGAQDSSIPFPISVKFNLKNTIATDAEMEKMRMDYVVGGKVSAGVINFDMGTEGMKFTMIRPNAKTIYFSSLASDQLKQMMTSVTSSMKESEDSEDTLKLFEGLMDGSYWKIDMDEYMKLMGEGMGEKPPQMDPQKFQVALRNLEKALEADTKKLNEEHFPKMVEYLSITNKGRGKVQNKDVIILAVAITDQEKMAQHWVEIVEDVLEVFKNHKADMVRYCEEVYGVDSDYTSRCGKVFEAFSEMKSSDREEFQKFLKQFFVNLEVSGLTFSISPVDNTILRTEGTVGISKKGLEQFSDFMNKSSGSSRNRGSKITELQFSFVHEELSRGKAVDVSEPKDTKNFVDIIKKLKEDSEKKAKQARLQSSYGTFGPLNKSLLPKNGNKQAQMYYEMGYSAWHLQRDWKTAKRYYEMSLQVDPNYVPALSSYGALIATFEGKRVEGKALLERAVNSNVKWPYASYNLGILYAQEGNMKKAEELINAAIKMYPNNPDNAYFKMALENLDQVPQEEL